MEKPSALLTRFQEHLDGLDYPRKPEGLYDPVRYALSLGGKRMRPLLLLMACNVYREDVEVAMELACGLELFHNYTLLHDDVMDRADIRRGMPTVHRKWDGNTAILSGDVMAFLAYRFVRRVPDDCLGDVLAVVDKAFVEVMEGQQHDMDFEKRNDVTEEEYMEMIRLKTSVLPAAALQLGAIVGGAHESDAMALYSFGLKMGLAFQLQDDLLDVYGDPKVFGKRIGGDILCNKKTYLYIKARLLADDECNAELDRWASYGDDKAAEKISGVTAVYDRLGVRGHCEHRIEALFAEAMECLEGMEVPAGRLAPLKEYVAGMMNRKL